MQSFCYLTFISELKEKSPLNIHAFFTIDQSLLTLTFIRVDWTGRFEAKRLFLVGCISFAVCSICLFHGMLHSKLPVAWWVYGRPAHLSYALMRHGCSTSQRAALGLTGTELAQHWLLTRRSIFDLLPFRKLQVFYCAPALYSWHDGRASATLVFNVNPGKCAFLGGWHLKWPHRWN